MVDAPATDQDDLRATITAALDTDIPESTDAVSREGRDEPANPDASVADVSPAVAEASTNNDDHPTDPLRYADGRFKPVKSDTAQAATADPKQPSKDAPVKASDPASTPVSAPPAGWTAAEKSEWAKLSPVAQAAVSRREAEIARGGQQWSDEKRGYQSLLSPLAQEAQRIGMTPEQGLQALLAAHHRMQTDLPGFIRDAAARAGLDLATLAGSTGSVATEQNQQPDIAALVRQAVQSQVAPLQQRFAVEDQQRQQSTVDTVTSFAASPGHEYFDAVQDELMAMIPTIKAANPAWTHEKVLQDAYDRAVYANPTTRASVLAAAQQASEAKRIEDAKQRTLKARNAGSSVTGSPNGAGVVQVPDNLRSVIEQAYAGSP